MAGLQALRENNPEVPAVNANRLLLWMSARRQGSWSQFRAAVEELHIPDVFRRAKLTP
jgi:hypothetical protein